MPMQISVATSLADIDAADWNSLNTSGSPFLMHEFLYGLESFRCLEPQGWHPTHLLLTDDNDRLFAAMPLYLRTNSYGEFVFDWAWADAFERAGGRYYPKFVSAIPFTPATGSRILCRSTHDLSIAFPALTSAAIEITKQNDASSFHCLFPTTEQSEAFQDNDLLIRTGCQFHWFNKDYVTFDDFLAALNSKRRKQIRKERREAAALGLTIETLHGSDITEQHWEVFHEFYCSTFYRKWGEPRLTKSFFLHLSDAMPDSPLLVLARDGDDYVAGSFSMIGGGTLYGRHWGCSQHFKQLHFELCYYQTIEFCIEHGITTFDAGAQGEHKIMRGFDPVKTWSAHWIADQNFRDAIVDFLDRETSHMNYYFDEMGGHRAYKKEPHFDERITIGTDAD